VAANATAILNDINLSTSQRLLEGSQKTKAQTPENPGLPVSPRNVNRVCSPDAFHTGRETLLDGGNKENVAIKVNDLKTTLGRKRTSVAPCA